VTGLKDKPRLTSEDLAFMVAPRLNAAGRLGQAQLGVELLITDDADRAQALADYIHQLNSSRESLERSITLAASKQIKEQFDPENDPALVLAGRGWHPGVIGIVAGRMAEKHHRPVVVIALDQVGAKPGTGSARTAGGFDLHRALAACSENLLGFGGHAAAAGLQIAEDRIEAFRADFCDYAAAEISEANREAEVRIDAEAPLSQLTLQTLLQIEQLAPFGAGNPRPVLSANGVSLGEPPKRMGGGDRHLSAKISQHGVTLRSVAFGQGDWAEELAQLSGPFDIAYRPVINDFRGRRNVELHLVDWRISQP
jgi:single-stranded-DNA-specific exonuclease